MDSNSSSRSIAKGCTAKGCQHTWDLAREILTIYKWGEGITMRVVQHWKLSREDAEPPSSEVIKIQLDKALSNLIFEISPCFCQEGGLDNSRAPFQPKSFNDSFSLFLLNVNCTFPGGWPAGRQLCRNGRRSPGWQEAEYEPAVCPCSRRHPGLP